MRSLFGAALLAVLLLLCPLLPAPAAAQEPVRADTLRAPAVPAGRAAPDTTAIDTIPSPGVPPTPAIEPAATDTIPPATPGDTLTLEEMAEDTLDARPPLAASADSVIRELRALPGYTVTEYLGDRARYSVEQGVLRLEGSAEVARTGDRLTADTIVYREGFDLVEAYGGPRVVGQGQELEGDSLFYDLATRRAIALGARTEVTQEATWYISGDMTLEGSDRLFGREAHFTSCDLAIPHYHFETDQVMVIRDQILVARPARLYFGNVPVMVLPFVVQSLETGRRSGFLTPKFGVHDIVRTSSGYNRQISDVGFYWAINDYMGAQLSTTWRSGAYTALLGGLDFNWQRQFLNGNVALERYWRETGGRELNLNTRGSWRPDERTNLNLSGRYASSADFVRDASYDPRDVTQDMLSSFSVNRRFGGGVSATVGADRRQSIATGDVSMTLPSFSLSIPAQTFFRPPSPDQARWFHNVSFTPGPVRGSRASSAYANTPGRPLRQDRQITRFDLAPSLSIGNFSLSTNASMNREELRLATGADPEGAPVILPEAHSDNATWSLSASYRQSLIGSTSISPNIRLDQEIVRDTLTADEYLLAPMRMSFGAGLNTDLYGFFPGVGGFSAIRHRFSPRLSYSYAPEVQQTDLQQEVFGQRGGRERNRISLGFDQTFEAKLRNPRPPEQDTLPQDTVVGDTIARFRQQPQPSDPEKVTLLSITTSALEYDFIQASEEGNGFVTDRVSNTIRSDYLRGLSIQMQHELFDRRDLDPADPANRGELGRFAPRLSSLSTSFELGPQTALFQWLGRIGLGFADDGRDPPESGADAAVMPGDLPSDDPSPRGVGTATANPQGTGAGPWRAALGYQFSRAPRRFTSGALATDQAIQTLDGNMSFQLSPNWGVEWATSYSITDGQFGSHRINFRRNLHEWQANFSFYQTPNGNTAFEFYVELLHNRDLRFDYAERNLGVDRGR